MLRLLKLCGCGSFYWSKFRTTVKVYRCGAKYEELQSGKALSTIAHAATNARLEVRVRADNKTRGHAVR